MLSKAGVATRMPIKDMDRAVRFYTEVLGGELQMRGEGEMKDYWASVRLGGQEFWLITPKKRERRDLAYTAFLVKNIKRTVEGLSRNGVKFDTDTPMTSGAKIEGPIAYYLFGAAATFQDGEGNRLMLWQQAGN